ncbi:c-type cytochrome, methanol metabolism-related [Roseivivax sp. CAU 1761]
MNRYGYSLLAAAAMTLSMGAIASADSHDTDAAAAPETEATAEAAAAETEATAEAAATDGDPNIAVAYEDNGRYYTEDDIPTFHVAEDGTVDWLTFSGFRRYHAECHVCHGPDGEGSTYAPAIKNSAVNMDYYDFYDTVVNGRKNGNSVMPHFGDNPNVMCYLDDIYVYLKARGADAVERGRPAQKEAKSDMIQEAENACMG